MSAIVPMQLPLNFRRSRPRTPGWRRMRTSRSIARYGSGSLAGVMVQPVLLDYGAVAEEIGWVGVESGIDNAKRILSRRGSFRMRVQFLEPFYPHDFPGRKTIAAESRRRIEEALVASLGHPLRHFAHAVEAVRYEAPEPPAA